MNSPAPTGWDATEPIELDVPQQAPPQAEPIPGEPLQGKHNPRISTPKFLRLGTVYDELTRQRAAQLIAKYPQSRSALLPLLHLVQSVDGCVSADGIEFCAEQLGLTAAEVEAVATFYTMYKRTPCGEHLVSVCTNTLCAALGGDAIYTSLRAKLGVADQETAGTPGEPGSVTIESAECLAACDHAPVVTVNYEFYDRQTVESAAELVDELQAGRRPAPTRGAALSSFKQTELELAGIFTGEQLSAEVAVPTASEQTLRGNTYAGEHAQVAPAMPDSYQMPDKPEPKS
ncbi:NADH-quinone oxidoreductase subunit NuoE [Nakamurella aerolata]|uniref:NADH-quinone oxidoreductase subunit NuoE n=1 Tax=Nakamurella aerolata TaxID=1656892 RepID=A0A849A383_9ACTN|nr:NADH-quinone oxidoreductase subunit NuoE [Nakamurella aerolata]NNG35069.1 NADH-quinone oxidoreductase subunit NuoE [Nakamurella aerolata]